MIDSTCTPKDKDEDDEETTDEERGSGEEGGEFIAKAEAMNEKKDQNRALYTIIEFVKEREFESEEDITIQPKRLINTCSVYIELNKHNKTN